MHYAAMFVDGDGWVGEWADTKRNKKKKTECGVPRGFSSLSCYLQGRAWEIGQGWMTGLIRCKEEM